MIESVFIKNFKKFERETIKIEQHNIIIGENDSGKSTILQALDVFFNQEKIDKTFVKNVGNPVEIGIRYNNETYKKIFSGASYKLSSTTDNIDDLNNIKYIYIPAGYHNVSEMIQQLSAAKVLENTDDKVIKKLKEISQDSINQVIEGIDKELIVLNKDDTDVIGEEKFNYNASLKFSVNYEGVAVGARGTGFQKNLLYALLVGNEFGNVILGLDEIENSFSINNAKNMLMQLHKKIGQTLITTHSPQIIKVRNNANIYPLLSDNNSSLIELLEILDNTGDKNYILVEGPFDLNWIKKSIELLKKSNDYIILPSGGCGNINHLKNELENDGKKCFIIKDGDTKDEKSLLKDCIELYAPVDAVNEILNLKLKEIPKTKEEFFEKTIIENVRNEDTVKEKISQNIGKYLTIDNPLVKEIESLLK